MQAFSQAGTETSAPWPRTPQEEPNLTAQGILVSRAQNGDSRAFESLYRQQVGRVYALCLRLVSNPAEAEELTQKTFIRAFEKLDSFRGESEFPSWLHRLAVNLVLTEMRSSRRRDERIVPVPDLEPLAVLRAEMPPSPGLGIDLERAIAVLSPRARAVFVLHDVEGFGHGEIADLMGLAEGTSKAHLHRARRRLREELRK